MPILQGVPMIYNNYTPFEILFMLLMLNPNLEPKGIE